MRMWKTSTTPRWNGIIERENTRDSYLGCSKTSKGHQWSFFFFCRLGKHRITCARIEIKIIRNVFACLCKENWGLRTCHYEPHVWNSEVPWAASMNKWAPWVDFPSMSGMSHSRSHHCVSHNLKVQKYSFRVSNKMIGAEVQRRDTCILRRIRNILLVSFRNFRESQGKSCGTLQAYFHLTLLTTEFFVMVTFVPRNRFLKISFSRGQLGTLLRLELFCPVDNPSNWFRVEYQIRTTGTV